MNFFILVCIFALGVAIGYRCVRHQKIEQDKTLLQEKEKLKRQIDAKQEQLHNIFNKIIESSTEYEQSMAALQKDYDKKRLALAEHTNELEKEYLSNQASFEGKTNLYKQSKFLDAYNAAAQYRQKLYDECQAYLVELQKMSNEKEVGYTSEMTNLQNEISLLKASRNALIEAKKREEELKLKTDFYKIKISENDKNDINLLKSIERYLYNKDPLYKLIWNTFYMASLKEMIARVIGTEKTSGIYKITNQLDERVYIGQSVDVAKRWTDHIKASLGIGTIAHQKIHDAMAANGIENFSFEIVERCPKEELNLKEKLWINTYQSDKYGYNQTAGGAKEI